MEYVLDTMSKRGWFMARCIDCSNYIWITKSMILHSYWKCWKCDNPFCIDEEAAKLITGAVCPQCRLMGATDLKSLMAMLYTPEQIAIQRAKIDAEQIAEVESGEEQAYNAQADAEDAALVEEEDL
jgi:hypothetical protein